jgi:hypothetical protein
MLISISYNSIRPAICSTDYPASSFPAMAHRYASTMTQDLLIKYIEMLALLLCYPKCALQQFN